MSRIVNKIKRHRRAAAAAVMLGGMITLLAVSGHCPAAVFLLAVCASDVAVVYRIREQRKPFGSRSRVRNVDTLIIGDISPRNAKECAECGDGGTAVCIYSPDCTLSGAYEVLRHTFSILKEQGGRAVLVAKEKNAFAGGYSLFDVIHFHMITVKRLGLERTARMGRFPVIFAPVKSFKFIFGERRGKALKVYHDCELEGFCRERGIELSILLKER